MELDCVTPAGAVLDAIDACLAGGTPVSPRGQACRERLNATIRIEEPWRVPFSISGRGLNQSIGALEALQLVGQTSRPERMPRAFDAFKNGSLLHGAYGPRVAGHLYKIQALLQRDQDSRQAVLSVYESTRDLFQPTKDTPCTLSIQFFIRNDSRFGRRLHARVSMRSNDVWLGLPYDLIQFIALQGAMAEALDLPMGEYTHTVGSLHLYERNVEAARHLSVEQMPVWDWHQDRCDGRIFHGFEGDIPVRSKWCREILDSSGITDKHLPSFSTVFEAFLVAEGVKK